MVRVGFESGFQNFLWIGYQIERRPGFVYGCYSDAREKKKPGKRESGLEMTSGVGRPKAREIFPSRESGYPSITRVLGQPETSLKSAQPKGVRKNRKRNPKNDRKTHCAHPDQTFTRRHRPNYNFFSLKRIKKAKTLNKKNFKNSHQA
ncbi:unnamed protein product [Meloidogyne enterolobii]|uniref:Uncharacterized protein n=1 Tax=Meloidogyne enterolobii TaxID=390850 RepID=A0ACB0ZL80_MELEN